MSEEMEFESTSDIVGKKTVQGKYKDDLKQISDMIS